MKAHLLGGSSALARMDVWSKTYLILFPPTLIPTSTLKH